MRAINTATLQLEEFFAETSSPYAILPHTWGADKVVFKDLTAGNIAYQTKLGWCKIVESSRYTSQNGWQYIWIDTCCINKPSVAFSLPKTLHAPKV
jgi:hypothetical protein